MRLRYARTSTAGPVRPINEDWLDFWEPADPLAREEQGGAALLADGVGGYANGEVASRLAVEEALRVFQCAPPDGKPYELLRQMFAAASRKVHAAAADYGGQAMATTLVASLFRNSSVYVANVGDSRAYFIRQKTIRRLTTDHITTALPVRLGLMLERQAMVNPKRSQLTRSVGAEAICQPAFATQFLHHGDFILQCSDGLYSCILDEEMREIITRQHPYDACKELVALSLKRGSDDNISLQLIEIRDWENVSLNPGRPAAADGMTTGPRRAASSLGGVEPAAGLVLDGRFELTDLVARSNMASIFKAKDQLTGKNVAIKLPLITAESDGTAIERFQREEDIGARLSHPGILQVIKVTGPKSRPYLVMEFLDGRTLAELLAKYRPLLESEARAYAIRICEALEYLHANGITHRDLKPQNIMVCWDGSLRLFDFGVARSETARRLTFVGLSPTLGTPDYISPEQVRGKRGDARSDIYSLGAILYEMVTGRTPFEGESPYVIMNARVTGDPPAPRKLASKLSPVLEEIILHALERDPAKRYQTASELKGELENMERVTLTHRDERLRSPQPFRTRSNLWILIGAIVLAQVAIFITLFWLLRRHR